MKGLHTIPDYSETYTEHKRPTLARCARLSCNRKFEKSAHLIRCCSDACENYARELEARLRAKYGR